MKKTKGAETKNVVRKIAYKLFLTQSYKNVTLREIEKEVNYSRGCIYYHYTSKQELFIDVIDYYVLHTPGLEVMDWDSYSTLLDFITSYIRKAEMTIKNNQTFLPSDSSINFTRAYMNLVLEAEKYYPEFNTYMNKVLQEELQCWECILTRAKEKKEIESTCNVSLLAKIFSNMVIGKLFRDTLDYGLKTEELKDLFYYQYNLIKRKRC